MNENLNLVEILKDASPGTKLWSPICGECEFNKICPDDYFPIECLTTNYLGKSEDIRFTAEGVFDDSFKNCECVLFPSKENHDWSTFKVPKKRKHFEPYQKVLVRIYKDASLGNKIWFPDMYLFYEEESDCHRVAINRKIYKDDNIIPYSGNEDKAGKIAE